MSFVLWLACDAGAAINNRASATFVGAAGTSITIESNTVRAVRPDSITYFTSAAYSHRTQRQPVPSGRRCRVQHR